MQLPIKLKDYSLRHYTRGLFRYSFLLLLLAGFALIMSGNALRHAPYAGSPKTSADALNSAATGDNPLPFDLPSQSSLKSSSHKVFALYFPPYPISIDNLSPDSDYYARNYLTVNGESGKHAAYGGLLRSRPLPQNPSSDPSWKLLNMETEVRRADNAGLDGFTNDILQLPGDPDTQVYQNALYLLQASQVVDSNFKIINELDMSGSLVNKDVNTMADFVNTLASYPASYRLPDGRLVLSAFEPEAHNATWWASLFNILQTKYGISVAFVPTFLNYSANAAAFAPISYGMGNWGNRSPAENQNLTTNITDAHNRGKLWFQPVSIQDERPDQGIYDEANNTENLRTTWGAAISGGADWVQIPTWNDYSESAEISPSTHTGWSPLDLNSYYLTRYKTGSYPAIKRDVIYVSHRIQMAAAKPTTAESLLMSLRSNSSPARDDVEVMSFLTAPQTISVTIGGATHTYTAPAGESTQLFPLALGTVSASINYANGSKRVVNDPYTVVANPPVQDLMYYFVNSAREGTTVAAPAPTTPAAPSTPSTPPSSTTTSSSTSPSESTNTGTASNPIKSGSTVTITVDSLSGKTPLVSNGGKIVIAPSSSHSKVTVKVDGNNVGSNTIDTSQLTNGEHTITVVQTTSNGHTKVVKRQVIVKNSPLRNAANHIRTNGVTYGVTLVLIGLIIAIVLRLHPGRYFNRHLIAQSPASPAEQETSATSVESPEANPVAPGAVVTPNNPSDNDKPYV